jgi:hypothetical protein
VRNVNVLKVDKDCVVPENWIQDYISVVLTVCKWFGVSVISIGACKSRMKGLHFYIEIAPSVEPEVANRLQWLIGDDCQRVDFNRARIESGLDCWNKLFEVAGRRLRTIYGTQQHSLRNTAY